MEDKCLVRTPSDRDFNERLQQLAIEAKQQPPLSPQRQLLLNRLVNKILQSGRLTHPQRGSWPPSLYEDLYNEALENCVQEWFDRSSFLLYFRLRRSTPLRSRERKPKTGRNRLRQKS
jgi:hypothetical protein